MRRRGSAIWSKRWSLNGLAHRIVWSPILQGEFQHISIYIEFVQFDVWFGSDVVFVGRSLPHSSGFGFKNVEFCARLLNDSLSPRSKQKLWHVKCNRWGKSMREWHWAHGCPYSWSHEWQTQSLRCFTHGQNVVDRKLRRAEVEEKEQMLLAWDPARLLPRRCLHAVLWDFQIFTLSASLLGIF